MTLHDLPTLNACLNTLSLVFLILGFVAIKKGNRHRHEKMMLAACCSSTLFLISYLTYHFGVALINKYPLHDWTRPVYLVILATHVVLAVAMAPGVILVLIAAWKGKLERHRRLAKVVWPVWVYVSFTGVVVYWMLYRYAIPAAASVGQPG